MNLPPHFVASQCRMEILSYIRGLILSGKPFRLKWAERDTGRSEKSIGSVLRYCRSHGIMTCERRHYDGIQGTRITLIGVGSTAWPSAKEVKPKKDMVICPVSPRIGEEEIVRRRIDAEETRIAMKRDNLAREYRGKGRHPSADKEFFDKATVLALSGGTMTSLTM